MAGTDFRNGAGDAKGDLDKGVRNNTHSDAAQDNHLISTVVNHVVISPLHTARVQIALRLVVVVQKERDKWYFDFCINILFLRRSPLKCYISSFLSRARKTLVGLYNFETIILRLYR